MYETREVPPVASPGQVNGIQSNVPHKLKLSNTLKVPFLTFYTFLILFTPFSCEERV